ncbi:hypothetical protein [Nocardia puris]|uniref:hypothetical protein n=1 Tax=Nocardia puris TaxID=208602 RepID=UPI0011BE09EC|nr:hypothetical protein [Nocardia puris]
MSAYGLTGVGVNLSAAKSDFVDRLGYAIEMAGRGIVVVQDQKYSVVVLAATLAGYTAVRLMVDEKSGRAYEWGPWSEEYKSPQDEAARTFRINSGAGTIVYQSEPDLAIEAK